MKFSDYVNIDIECSDIINFYKKNKIYMYRGEDKLSKVFSRDIWKNRKSVDSINYLHNILNIGFKHVFNKRLRSESIFCVGSEQYASNFGNSYIILPVNGFDVYWSPLVNDIASPDWIYDKRIADEKDEDILAFVLIRCLTYKYPPKIVDVILDTVVDKLSKVPDIDSTILAHDIGYRTEIAEEVEFLNPNCVYSFIRKYYKKGDLASAIKSGHEMMITGSKYYAIEPNAIEKYLR